MVCPSFHQDSADDTCHCHRRYGHYELLGVSPTISTDFDFGVTASREGPIEKIAQLGRKMALA